MAREPIAVDSDEDRLILESFLRHVDGAVARVTPEAVADIEQAEDICWVWSQYVRMPLAAFMLTGDTRHLDAFVQAMDNLLTRLRPGPDGYLGFRGLPLPLFRDPDNPTAEVDVDISEFEIVRLMCEFAEAVRADETLRERYGEDVERYLALAREHLAEPKWDERGLYVDLGEEGAVFRMPPECGNNRDSLTNPHNKQSKMCRAYLALYRVTGEDDYFRRAVKLGTRFKHTLRLDGDHYLWNYWDAAGDWDRRADDPDRWKHWIGPEHRGGYHSLTVQMAVELWDHGVVFDDTDMQRFVNTQMQVCWNGSLDEPEFRTTAGQAPREEAYGVFMASSLARFEPLIHEYCYGARATQERLDNRGHGWRGGVVAIGYLVGKYLAEHEPVPMRAGYGAQFRARPEGAAFLEELAFEVGG